MSTPSGTTDPIVLRSLNTAHLGEVQPETFRKLMQGIAAIAALTHVSFLCVFLWAGVDLLALVNVGSVACYVWVFFVSRSPRYRIETAWTATVLEVLGHAVLATFVIGWGSGFHHYILLVIPVAVVSPIRPLALKAATVLAVALTYIVLDATLRHRVPPHVLPAAVQEGLYYFNVFGTMLILTFLAGCYYYLINQAHAALRELATTDPLTQLRNRRSITEAIRREEARVQRGVPYLSFVLCDLDHFKSINDTRGHDAGDLVLKAVSAALSKGVRDVDFLARWGGEEFLAVLPDTNGDGAALVAERLREFVAALELTHDGQPLRVTTTLGVATLREGETAEQAIARADAALYEGKRGGRNRVVRADALPVARAAVAAVHPAELPAV